MEVLGLLDSVTLVSTEVGIELYLFSNRQGDIHLNIFL